MTGAPAATPVTYSDDYYRQVVAQYGYSPFDFQDFDFTLAGIGQRELNIRYLCHHRGDTFAATPAQSRIVTTGFGMSGPPHMATASHIMKIIQLQRGGERCQIVLGDLDAYNGRNRAHAYTTDLAQRFATFITRLGFDPHRGILRGQTADTDTLHTMYLLGRYTHESDFNNAEEDNHPYYAAHGIVDDTMTFRRRLSLTLMAADFITLGQTVPSVLVLLGVDEHKYVRFTQTVARRFDDHTPLSGDFTLAAAYTRMNTGFAGHPKFSKSIPESSIHVESTNDHIKQRIAGDTTTCPTDSPVFQLMCHTTYCDMDKLAQLHTICQEGGPRWRREREEFTDYLVSIKDLWPRP